MCLKDEKINDFKNYRRPGTYVLILKLEKDEFIQIGKLGKFFFLPGYYAYIGSAFGSGGLAGRLNHHLKVNTHPHWHIDYLRKVAQIIQIWLVQQEIHREHDWAALMSQMDKATIAVEGFGCSDCQCETHLFYFAKMPSKKEFQWLVLSRFPEDSPLQMVLYQNKL